MNLNVKLNYKKYLFRSAAGLIGSICTFALAFKVYTKQLAANQTVNADESVFADSCCEPSLESNLLNAHPAYIEGHTFENLISLPRYQRALYFIKQANRVNSKENNQRVIDEIVKLDFEKTKADNLQCNLNNGFAHQISQLLNDELMLHLAFKAPQVDNQFFRIEPPTTVQKLKKSKAKKCSANLYEDPDYALIFEFFNHLAAPIEQKYKKHVSPINSMLKRLSDEINSLVSSEYLVSERVKFNVWSSTEDLNEFDFEEEEEYLYEKASIDKHEDSVRVNSLKQKLKNEFIERNELLIMKLIEKLASLDAQQLVQINGLEMLLLIYEKHKHDEKYVNSIGNCLSLISLNPDNRRLFIQSGWLKRLNEMYNKLDSHEPDKQSLNLQRELIAHKILFNLNQNMEQQESHPILYSTMVYPLNPIDSDAIELSSTAIERVVDHKHVVDVVFLHGIRGSLFRTWRQDKVEKQTQVKPEEEAKSEFTQLENKILEKIEIINNLIEAHSRFSYCWPKDWLCNDLNSIDESEFRLIGINYESLFSMWEQEETIDDKKFKQGIKERAVDMIEQLKKAHVGDRPIVWICHSMGGLIVKQMLVHLSELEAKLDKQRITVQDKNKLVSSIVANTKAITFLSTPHLGSSIAKTMSTFSFALYPTTEIVELSSNSSYLLDLNKKFLNLIKAKNGHYEVLSLCEGMPTHYFYNYYNTTVTEASAAAIGVGEFHIVKNKDHMNICKPANKDCFVYEKILNLITNAVKAEYSKCQKCKLESSLRAEKNAVHFFRYFNSFSNF